MVRAAFASLLAVAGAQVCPFSGGLTRQPNLPKQANCPNGVNYVEGGEGNKFVLSTADSGACSYGVLGGDCGGMALGDIDRIELDVSVSEECQSKACSGARGDWVAVWLDPHSGWTNEREVDLMETVFGPGGSYAKTNFCTTGNPVDWQLSAPFAQHVTMTGADNAKGGRDVYVAHCAKGSGSCKTGPGVQGNAYKLNMERDIVYRLLVDNWGNFCGNGGAAATPNCAVTVENVRVTLASSPAPSPAPSPTPTPSPAPSPAPGQWSPCGAGDECCNPNAEAKQYCPSGDLCQGCGGGDACRCPSAAENAVLV